MLLAIKDKTLIQRIQVLIYVFTRISFYQFLQEWCYCVE